MIGGVVLAGRMVACLAGAALAACLVVVLILAGGSDEAGAGVGADAGHEGHRGGH